MAETIRGISVVIGSDTTGLSKALGDVNKKSRDIQAELRQVEKLLKLNPEDTILLAQKQKLLAEAIANSSEKLTRLKSAQEQVNEQFRKGDISEGQYRAFQREVAASEQKLRGFEHRLESSEESVKDLGETLQKTGDQLKGIGEKLSVGVTAPLVGFAALATEGTRELRTELAKLETNAQMAKADIDVVNQAYRDMYAITGELDSNVEGLSNLLAAGFDGTQMTQVMEQVAGAAIKFKDTLKFEGIADGLQETLATGAAIGPFAELLDRLGVNLDKFNAGLKDAIKNGTEQQYVLDILAKQGLADVYNQYTKNNAALVDSAKAQYDLQVATAEFGKAIEPIMTQMVSQVTELVEWFNELSPAGKDFALVVGGIAVAAGPTLWAIGSMAEGLGVLTKALGVAGGASGGTGIALSALATGPIGAVILAVAGMALAWKLWGEDVDRAINRVEAKMKGFRQWLREHGVDVATEAEVYGRNIPEGMSRGMDAGASQVEASAINLARASINAMNHTLDIHSPSKVMEDIGAACIEKGNKNTKKLAKKSLLMLKSMKISMAKALSLGAVVRA